MLATASLVALADPQVCRERLLTSVSGQVGQEVGSSGGADERPPTVRALSAHEERPAGLRAQFDCPGAPDSRTCEAEPHGARLSPVVHCAGSLPDWSQAHTLVQTSALRSRS
ncbi:hypothetical protein GCM10010256_83970 [Streptomyces coeruleorubidus]|nr:hypothetical protein GCM10010256_83970 [Streptomyces coeruleorubidus]